MSLMKWMAGLLLIVGLTAIADAEAPSLTEKNKQIVTDFYKTVFVDHRVEEGFEKYVGETYTQHNPSVPDGKLAAVTYLKLILGPTASSSLKRVVAENDLVTLHHHARRNADDVGLAIIDIFRVQDGKVVEHWDVIQPVSQMPLNQNTMF